MHQFFVEDHQVGKDFITITGKDVHHIRNVLRMSQGEVVRISSTGGRNYRCRVLEVADEFVQMDILDSEVSGTELSGRILLFQGLPKGERMEYIIQKTVELGVTEIIPVAMRYCVVKLEGSRAGKKISRWQTIAENAAKQSKRSVIPKIHPVMSFPEAAACASGCDRCLVPYENERGMEATREALSSLRGAKSVSLFIGPEGGFAPEEIEILRRDMQVISLGRRILRTDTAAITSVSMMMLQMEMDEALSGGNQIRNESVLNDVRAESGKE